jgi:hypothetical protein
VNAANATPTQWNWWANGWTASPAPGIPPNVRGYTYFNKKSWMTETSGENPAWLFPASGYPSEGAWGLAMRIHQALVAGQQSAWIYWQATDGGAVGAQTLTDATFQDERRQIRRLQTLFPLHPARRCEEHLGQRLDQSSGRLSP